MPRIPDPPRKGHPARPRREDDERDEATKKPARSFGQSAPMPEDDAAEAVVEEIEDFEDLTLEPVREDEGDAEQGEEKPRQNLGRADEQAQRRRPLDG